MPAAAIRDVAHAYAKAKKAQLCWTLGITEHHNARRQRLRADQSGAADGSRRPLGLRASARCADRTTCRAAATWAPCPTSCRAATTSRTRCRGRSSSARGARRDSADHAAGTSRGCSRRWSTGSSVAVRPRREPGPVGGRPDARDALLSGLDHIVVQDMFLTRTGEMAHVVLPAAASWCEDEGTVTSSERRVQRVRKALDPPGQARPTWRSSSSSASASAWTSEARRPSRSGTSCARSRPGTAE